MMTIDDKEKHEVDNDKVKDSFGDNIKTCFDYTLMQYWSWPKIARKSPKPGC